jgi:dihydroxyacetone kinase
MVVNFNARGISRGARKLTRTSTLIKKKLNKAQVKQMEQMTILLNNLGVMKLNKTSLLLPFTNKRNTRRKKTW